MPQNSGVGGSRLAATVLLVRDGRQGLEVCVQERVSAMPNYPGMTVFPGGGVDRRDFALVDENEDGVEDLWSGRPLEDTADVLGVPTQQARARVFAAVRELFEETGTLLAVHRNRTTVADATPFHADRLALESHRLSLTQVLHRGKLRVHSDMLRPWARWVGTSERGNTFDNTSFLAVHPVGQEPDGQSSETDSAGWFPPSLLLDGWRTGLVRLVIPTWAQLKRLADCRTVAEALAEAEHSDMTPVVGDPVDDARYREFFTIDRPDRI